MITPKQKLPSSPPTQAGFTLIECLLAIIIVALLMVAVAPAVVLSMATRVQSRRVELATAAARTYIDGIRSGTIKKPISIAPIEKQGVSLFLISSASAVPALQGPSSTLTCTPPSTTSPLPKGYYCDPQEELGTAPTGAIGLNKQSLYCVNLNGSGCNNSPEGRQNFIIQAIRSVTPNPNGAQLPPQDLDGSQGYFLGVRVYRVDAFDNSGSQLPTKPLDGKKRVATFTGGLGDRRAPIVEMATEIRTSDTSYKSLCARLGGCQ